MFTSVDSWHVTIESFHPSADGQTFEYCINVSIEGVEWLVSRRFSEFHSLHNRLFNQGYGTLPRIPGKTLKRPNDPSIAETRRKKLNIYLTELIIRPDLRHSEPLVSFLQIDQHLGMYIPSLQLTSVAGSLEYLFYSVVDISSSRDLVVIAQSDLTALSRIGKAWSMVDPERVAAVCLYKLMRVTDDPSRITLATLFARTTQKRIRVVHLLEHAPIILVGDDSGVLSVYKFDQNDGRCDLTVIQTLEMHIHAPFISLRSVGDMLASLGEDSGVRVCQINQAGQINVISSGRITRPLSHANEKLASICLLPQLSPDTVLPELNIPQCPKPNQGCLSPGGTEFQPVEQSEAERRMPMILVGTTCGKLLVYRTETHPPVFLGSLDVCQLIRRLDDPYTTQYEPMDEVTSGVTCIEVMQDGVVVGIDAEILVLSAGLFRCKCLQEAFRQLLVGSVASLSEGVRKWLRHPGGGGLTGTGGRLTALTYWSEQRMIFCSYTHGICVWDLRGGIEIGSPDEGAWDAPLLQSTEFFKWGTIRSLKIRSPYLFVGTSIKGLQVITLESTQYWTLWEEGLRRIRGAAASAKHAPPAAAVAPPKENEISSPLEDDFANIYSAFGPARF